MGRADIFTWMLKWPSGFKNYTSVLSGYDLILGIGVVQPQSGIDYPLVSPSIDMEELLADLFLSYDDPGDYGGTSYVYPFSISWLYGLGTTAVTAPAGVPTPVNDKEILITDANGREVFNSADSEVEYSFSEWGDALGVVEWIKGTEVCRLVYYRCLSETGTQLDCDEDNHIVPISAVIDSRAIYRKPKHVKSVSVELDTMTASPIQFAEGNNIEFSTEPYESGKEQTNTVIVKAGAGLGTGKYNNCDELDLDYLTSINGKAPTDNGDFFIEAEECYWVKQATAIESTNPLILKPSISDTVNGSHLTIGNDCGPCCNCDDYVNLGLRTNNTGSDYQTIYNRLYTVKQQYEQIVARWEKIVECLKRKPIKVVALAQSCPYADIAVQIKNTSDECWDDVELTITMDPESIEGIGSVTPEIMHGFSSLVARVSKNDKLIVKDYSSFPVLVKWPSIPPGGAITQKLRIKFPDCGCENALDVLSGSDCEPYSAAFCATATVNGETLQVIDETGSLINAQGCDSVTLKCPPEDGDAVNLGECMS